MADNFLEFDDDPFEDDGLPSLFSHRFGNDPFPTPRPSFGSFFTSLPGYPPPPNPLSFSSCIRRGPSPRPDSSLHAHGVASAFASSSTAAVAATEAPFGSVFPQFPSAWPATSAPTPSSATTATTATTTTVRHSNRQRPTRPPTPRSRPDPPQPVHVPLNLDLIARTPQSAIPTNNNNNPPPNIPEPHILPLPANYSSTVPSRTADAWQLQSLSTVGNVTVPNPSIQTRTQTQTRELDSDECYQSELASRDSPSPPIPSQSHSRPPRFGNTATLNPPLGLGDETALYNQLSNPLAIFNRSHARRERETPLAGTVFENPLATLLNSRTAEREPPISRDLLSLASLTGSRPASPDMSASTRSRSKRNPGVINLASSSPTAPSPRLRTSQARRRDSAAGPAGGLPGEAARKRKREEAPTKTIQRPINDETDDEFGADDDIKVVDLVDAVEVPDSIRAPKPPNNEVKLSAFQCVICMDDVTDLTVTHCGHLFCAECLHSSLNIDVTRSICPICRQKIDIKLANGKFTSKSKGFYPLELKFATRKGLGKRPTRP